MELELEERVVPALRSVGFRGSFPHFRRIGPEQVDLLSFQFDKYGGGFIVEIAQCPAAGFETPWGEHIPAKRVNARHIAHPRPRLRPDGEDEGFWFRFDGGETPQSAAALLIPLIATKAEIWWRTRGHSSL